MEPVLITGATAGALLTVATLARVVWRAWQRIDAFLTDWFGEPPRPGYPGRKSIPERVHVLEAHLLHVREQVTPNGGDTDALGDRVQRIERHLGIKKPTHRKEQQA